MKTAKKIFAVLLVAVMLLALGATVFADDTNSTANGTITISNATEGATYTVYKVFDLAYADDDATTVAYTYTSTGENDALLSALLNGYTVTSSEGETTTYESPFTLTETTVSGTYNVTIKTTTTENDDGSTTTTEASINDIVTFLTALVKGNVLATSIESIKAESTTVKFEKLSYGYYYITSTTGAVVSLTSTTPDATVVDKNYVPFDKKEEVNGTTANDEDDTNADTLSVEVGDTVNYTITGEVPDYTSFTFYTYQVTDTMSEGLTFNEDVTVKVGDTELTVGTDYTISYANNGFTLTIDVLGQEMEIGATITVTYSATVNENAVSQISKNNVITEGTWAKSTNK